MTPDSARPYFPDDDSVTHGAAPTANTPYCKRFSVGLTGGIASGKSAVAQRLAELGAAVVDTDVIAHTLTQPSGAAMPAIIKQFGEGYANPDGSMNRVAMRGRVFDDALERRKLEAILHPLIQTQTQLQGASVPGSYVVFVVPLLAQAPHWFGRVNRIAVVDCALSTQLARLAARSGIGKTQGEQILAAQSTREQRLHIADDVIENAGSWQQLTERVLALHFKYMAYAADHPDADGLDP